MTLKEKFYKESIYNNDVYPLEEYEKIADSFAIGFAKWMYDYKGDVNKVEELLEIYKKEKGL
jgi:hypothetical protein